MLSVAAAACAGLLVAASAGGESGDAKSKHFTDQAQRYATGNLREVYFYPNQLTGHTEKTYHPGN